MHDYLHFNLSISASGNQDTWTMMGYTPGIYFVRVATYVSSLVGASVPATAVKSAAERLIHVYREMGCFATCSCACNMWNTSMCACLTLSTWVGTYITPFYVLQDRTFKVPRCVTAAKLSTRVPYASPENATLARLFTSLLRLDLHEYAYDAVTGEQQQQ